MTTIAGIFAASGPITIAMSESARTRLASSSSSSSSTSASHFADLSTIYRRVGELGRALDEAQSVFESLRMGTQAAGQGQAISENALGIDPSPRVSSMLATEEANTVPTSYSPFGPDWTGASTTPVTVGGTYNGDYGDDTLRLKVTQNRTVGGSSNIRIKIYDSSDKRIENLNWPAWTPPDTEMTSSKTGLTVSLGAGITKKNDTFYVDVSTSVDSEIDPDLAFDGTRNDNPNLEPGLPISAGSFYVNGEEITVDADDTVIGVLDKINASAAGVTAIYDPTSELVSVERDDPGALDITISGDTSGFVDSMKLTGATVVLGNEEGELNIVMEDVGALSGTMAGTITVNEVEIAIDPSTDTLVDVMDAINSSEAGVTASFDEESLVVTIAANGAGGNVTLEDGGANFLPQIDIEPGTYQGRRSAQLSKIKARRAQRAMAEVAEAFENLQNADVNDSSAQSTLAGVVSSVESAITSALGDHEDVMSDAGLSFDLDADDSDDPVSMTATLFERALRASDGDDLEEAMVGSILNDDDGLLGLMSAAVDDLETTLRRATGDVGAYLSTYA